MTHRSHPRYYKGEVVFCPNKEEKMWPARIETIGQKYEIKHFRVRQTIWVDAKKLQKFTEEAKEAYLQKGKIYLHALKVAEKVHEQNLEDKIIEVSVEPKVEEDEESADKSQICKLECKEEEDSSNKEDKHQENLGFIDTIRNISKEQLIQSIKIGKWVAVPFQTSTSKRKSISFPTKLVYIQFVHALLSSLFYSRPSKSLYFTILHLLRACPLHPCQILIEGITISLNEYIRCKSISLPNKSENQFVLQLKKWRKELQAKIEEQLDEDDGWQALIEQNNKLNIMLDL